MLLSFRMFSLCQLHGSPHVGNFDERSRNSNRESPRPEDMKAEGPVRAVSDLWERTSDALSVLASLLFFLVALQIFTCQPCPPRHEVTRPNMSS